MVENKINIFRYPDPENITMETVKQFIDKHKMERVPLFQENENFILQRNLDIDSEFVNEEKAGTFVGVKNKNNIAQVIVNTQFSYVMGEELVYTSDEEDRKQLETYLMIREENNGKDKEQKVALDLGTFGMAYELLYMEGNNIRFSNVSPFEAFIIYDYSLEPKPIYGVRYYSNFENNIEVELYSKTYFKKVMYVEKAYKIMEEKQNLFNVMPLIEYVNNDYAQCDFQPVKSYLNDINKTLTTESNIISYFNDALLVLTNVETTLDEVKTMRENKIVVLTNTDAVKSDISFLEKPLNVDAMNQHLDRLYKNTFNESFTPYISNEELAKAPSGRALQMMYISADLIAKIKEKNLTKGFKQRIDIIFRMLNFTKLNDYLKYNSIKPVFTRNLPTLSSSDLEDLQALVSTGVKVSNRTLLELIPNKYIDNAEKEIERIKEEQGEDYLNDDLGVGVDESGTI